MYCSQQHPLQTSSEIKHDVKSTKTQVVALFQYLVLSKIKKTQRNSYMLDKVGETGTTLLPANAKKLHIRLEYVSFSEIVIPLSRVKIYSLKRLFIFDCLRVIRTVQMR